MAKKSEMAGCVTALITLFVNAPLSWAMWYGVLTITKAPTWMWVCLIVSVPFFILNLAATTLAKIMEDE